MTHYHRAVLHAFCFSMDSRSLKKQGFYFSPGIQLLNKRLCVFVRQGKAEGF